MTSIEEQFSAVRERISQEQPLTAEALERLFEQVPLPEGLPRPEVTVFFGAHKDAEDLESMQTAFADADVYVPENIGHTDAVRELYQRVSDGVDVDSAMEQAAQEGGLDLERLRSYRFFAFFKAELEMLHGTRKGVMMIDLPLGHAHLEYVRSVLHELEKPLPRDVPFSDAMVLVRSRAMRLIGVQTEREKYMVDRFPVALAELVRARPTLGSQSGVRVLVRIGAAHAPILSRFVEADIPVASESQFEEGEPDAGSLMVQLVKGEQPSDKYFAHFLLLGLLGSRISYSGNRRTFSSRLLRAFSVEEVADLWEQNRAAPISGPELHKLLIEKGVVSADE